MTAHTVKTALAALDAHRLDVGLEPALGTVGIDRRQEGEQVARAPGEHRHLRRECAAVQRRTRQAQPECRDTHGAERGAQVPAQPRPESPESPMDIAPGPEVMEEKPTPQPEAVQKPEPDPVVEPSPAPKVVPMTANRAA